MPQFLLGPIIDGLSDTFANLWGRTNYAGTIHAWLGRKRELSNALPTGGSAPLCPNDGYAGVVPVSGLKPETTNYYDLRLYKSAPSVRDGYPKFTIFLSQGKPCDFSFAFGSCFRPEKAIKSISMTGITTDSSNSTKEELKEPTPWMIIATCTNIPGRTRLSTTY